MDEDERQRKLQAGKEKFAEFLRKKNSPKKRRKKTLDGGGDTSEVTMLDDSSNVNKTAASSLPEKHLHDSSVDGTSLEKYLHDSSVDGTSLEDVEISFSETLDDTRWTKEKILELEHSIETKQAEWDDLQKENKSFNDQLINSYGNEDVHFVIKPDDLRETDYRSMVEEYRRRIEEFQTALSQRDDIITQLSDRLMVTLQNRDAIQMEAAVQAEGLAQEISILKLQLQQASEIFSRQKDKDGISAEELLEARNQIISLNQELHCVKENLNKLQHQNILLVQEIQTTKIESSNEEFKCQIDSLIKEKELLSKEVYRLKCVEDELNQANEKSRLSDILVKQLQEHNNSLQKEIETMKTESSNEFKCQLDSVIKEKEMLSEEVYRLKGIEDEFTQVNEKSRLSDILIKQLQEDKNHLQEENSLMKRELSFSHQQLADILSELKTSNVRIEELLKKQENYEKILFESKQAENTIEQLTSELTKTQKELDNAQKQLNSTQAQLEDINQKYIFLQDESRKIHETYGLTIENTKEELREKHEVEVEEKEITLNKLVSSVQQKLVIQEEEYRNQIELLECRHADEITKYKEQYNDLLTRKEELENRIKTIENPSFQNKVSVVEENPTDVSLNSAVTRINNENSYDSNIVNLTEAHELQKENMLPFLEPSTTYDDTLVVDSVLPQFIPNQIDFEKSIENVLMNSQNWNNIQMQECSVANNESYIDENLLLQNTSYLSLKWLKEFTNNQELENYVDDAILRIKNEKAEVERHLLDQIHNLELANCDLQSKVEELKIQYDHLKSCKESLENELSEKGQHTSEVFETNALDSLFDNDNAVEPFSVTMYTTEIAILKNKLLLECSIKESLSACVNHLKRKCDLYEKHKYDMGNQLDGMREQLKYAWQQYDKAVKELFEISVCKSICEDTNLPLKNETDMHNNTKRTSVTSSDCLLLPNESDLSPIVSNNILDAEVEALRLELKEMKELFTKENAQLRIALEHQQQCVKTYSDAQKFGNIESNETIDISHKLLLLADSNRELLEKKEELQVQLAQQEQLLKDIWNAFHDEESGQNLLQDHLYKLQEQSKEMMQELQQHNGIHNTIIEILSNNLFQKYLQVHKEVCLSKIHDKELLEAEMIRLRKDLEFQSKELQRLEVKLENKNTLEQTLVKQKRVLEEELSEIQQKLREHKENLLTEKALLETELREKDIILKKTELEVQHKEVELQGQTSALKADYEACLSNMHIKVSEETWNHITKLRNDLEITHQQAMQFLKNNLEKECAMKELKTAEEHMNEVAELKAYHKEQIAALHAQLEARMAAIREEGYIEIIGIDDIAHKLKQKWNDYQEKFTLLRSQLDENQQSALDNIFDDWKELHNEELEQFKQKFNAKIEEELHNQRERMLKMNHSALESFEAGLNQEKLEALCEQHEILTEQHNEQLAYIQKQNEKEMEILTNIHRMQLQQLFIQQKPVSEVQAAKHKLAEQHYRCIQNLVSKWTEENIKRLNKLRVIAGHKSDEDCYNPNESLKYTVEDIEDLLLERKIILNEADGIKHYINNNINDVDLLKDHLLQAYETLLDTYQSKIDSKSNNEVRLTNEDTNSLTKLSIKEIDSNMEVIESSNGNKGKECKTQIPNVSLEETGDLEHINSHSVTSALEIEEYYIKQYEQKIEQYKTQLDNVVKELISNHHKAEEALRGEFEVQLSTNLELISAQLDVKHRKEIERFVENFHKEKSDLQQRFIENVAKEVTKVRVVCAENAAENFAIENDKLLQKHQTELENLKKEMKEEFSKEKAALCTENVQRFKELMENYTSEKNRLVELIETEKVRRMNDQEESKKVYNELQQKISALNTQLCKVQQEKTKLEQELDIQIADLIQDHHQEMEALCDKLHKEFKEEKNNLQKQFTAEIEKMKSIHNENMDDLWKKLEKEYKEEKNIIKAEEEKRFSDMIRIHTNEVERLQLKIDETHEEKHVLLSNHASEIANMTSRHEEELENILSKLQLKIHEEKGDLVNQVSSRVGEDIVRLRTTLEQTTSQVASEIAKVIKEKNIDLKGKAINEDLEDTLKNLKTDLEMKTRALEDLQRKYNSEIADVENQEQRWNMLPDCEKIPVEKEDKSIITDETCQDLNLKSELMEEMEQLQSQMEKDMAAYTQENCRLFEELKQLEVTRRALESDLEKATVALKEKEKKFKSPEAKQNKEWLTGTELSTVDIRSWQVQTAQTNSRLLHVLSDLVKTFFDIEQDINSRLIQLGLDVINSTEGGTAQDEEGALISAQGTIGGSREDFSVFMSETINLELSEDGIDLTPRSWDLFTSSIAAHEVEMEGEDVVLGASKRLRSAVERVLRLLSLAVEVQQHQDLRVLLCRNEELSQELQEEMQNKDSLQMELIRVEGLLRNTEQEKQKLEDCAHVLKEAKDALSKELDLIRQRLHHLEEAQDTLTEEKRYAIEQCQMIANTLGKPEQTTTEDVEVTACTETVSPEQEVLLQENSKLSTERHRLQQNHDKERQRLLSHIHHLELALEESNSQKEDILEEKSKEIEDLKSQMESIEKQLFSYKKFIEEQAQEREQERDEYLREVTKLHDIVREKERIQNNEDRLTREIETLEHQLRVKIEDQAEVLRKREKLETDLTQSIDKIHDLRDVISELERQLDLKSRREADLKQQILNLEEAVSNHEKENTEINNELEQLRTMSSSSELNDHIRALEDQLESKGQQLEQMINCQSVLQEFRGHIHSLEAKIDSKVRHLETQKLSLLSASPVPSDDISFSGSQDGERRPLSVEDVRVYSPSSLTWDEMKRFEDKIDRLVKMEEELFKRNKDMEQQIKNSKQTDEEMVHVKNALQEQVNSQLLTISALRAQIEEKKHNSKQDTSNRIKTEIAQLKQSLENEKQQQEFLENKIQEQQAEICRLEQQLQEKDEMQKENVFNKTESEVLIQELSSLKDENSDLKHEMEKLRFASESSSLPDYAKLLLDDKNDEIDYLNQQVYDLQGLLETFRNANKPTESNEIKEMIKEKDEELDALRNLLTDKEEQTDKLISELQECKKELTYVKELLAQAKPDEISEEIISKGTSWICGKCNENKLNVASMQDFVSQGGNLLQEITQGLECEIPATQMNFSINNDNKRRLVNEICKKEEEINTLTFKLHQCKAELSELKKSLQTHEVENNLKNDLDEVVEEVITKKEAWTVGQKITNNTEEEETPLNSHLLSASGHSSNNNKLSEIEKELDIRNKELTEVNHMLEVREKEIEELNKQIDHYKKELTELKQQLKNVEEVSHDSLKPVAENLIIKQSAWKTGQDSNKERQVPDGCQQCIKLEIALIEVSSTRDNLQQQVNALVSELDSFAKHHGMTNRVSDKGCCDMLDKLQEDFDTMQKIAEKKEEELVQLQEEAETQVQLQSKLEELQKTLEVERKDIAAKNEEIKKLNEKVKELQSSLEEAQDSHEKQVILWHQQIEKINDSHAKTQEALRQEVICLREQFPEKEKSPILDSIVQNEERRESLYRTEEFPLTVDEANLHIQIFNDTNKNNNEINNPNCKECIKKQKILESTKQNFEQEKTQLVMFLKEAQAKVKEYEARLNEEKEYLKKKYDAEISDIQLQWEKVEKLLRNTHQEEIEHIKTCLEEAFQDEKKMIIQTHDQQMKCVKQDLEEKYENERLELVTQFEEVLRTSKEKMEKKLTMEKEKLECMYKERYNLIQLENEKRAYSEKITANEKENLHKTCEEEKRQLLLLHKKELDRIEKETKEKLTHLQSTLDKTYIDKLNQLELKHKQEIKTMKDVLKKTRSEASSSREKINARQLNSPECTPLSDATSSQGTSTSPEEEMRGVLSTNIQKLLDKVYKEGVKVLSLTERQLLKHHLTPPSENGNSSAFTADWLREKQILLDEIHSLKELIKEQGTEVNSWEHIVEQIALTFRKEQEKLIRELKDQARTTGEVNQINGKSLEERISELELQNGAAIRQITQGLIEELKNAKKELNNQCTGHIHLIEELEEKLHLSEEQKSQIEWQLKTQRDLLEFRAKQEKVLADDLQMSLDAEKTRNMEVTTQLNKQRKALAELEMANSSSQAEILCLRQSLEGEKQRLSSCLNALDMEKSHSQSLFQALESERASFSHLQVALESERQRSKAVREHDQQIIRDLREMLLMAERGNSSSKFSVASMRMETEKIRDAESRLADKISLPSSDFQDLDLVPTSPSLQMCPKCARLEKMLAKERAIWIEQHTNLNKSLQEANNEVLRLKHLIQTVDLPKNTNGMDTKLHHLYWKYRRSESYRQALIFQKNYLLMLLDGFQSTEEATITALVHLGTNNTQETNAKLTVFSRGGHTKSGLFRFKSVTYAVLALYRMKYLVRRWQKAAQVPSSRAVAQEVDSIEQAFTVLGIKNGSILPGNELSHAIPQSSLYKHYLASKSVSPPLLQGGSAILDRTETNSLRRLSPKASSLSGTGVHQTNERGRLGEYITRLEFLHRQLGLDSTEK